jgi:hypothetical protein
MNQRYKGLTLKLFLGYFAHRSNLEKMRSTKGEDACSPLSFLILNNPRRKTVGNDQAELYGLLLPLREILSRPGGQSDAVLSKGLRTPSAFFLTTWV